MRNYLCVLSVWLICTTTSIAQNNTSGFRPAESTESSIDESNNESNVLLYPNPASEFISIRLNELSPRSDAVQIYNILGKKLIDLPASGGNTRTVSVNILPAGMYFIKYENRQGSLVTKKFYIN